MRFARLAVPRLKTQLNAVRPPAASARLDGQELQLPDVLRLQAGEACWSPSGSCSNIPGNASAKMRHSDGLR